MNAAIYARISDVDRNAADDVKSTARQVAHARAFAAQKGWTVVAEYVDEGVSGGSFDPVQRPQFFALLNAATAKRKAGTKPPFEAVIVRDLDRYGRDDSGRQLQTLVQLDVSGVRVWSYTDGRAIDVSSPEARIIASVLSGLAASERLKARSRTLAAVTDKAKTGAPLGAPAYGYAAVEKTAGDKRVGVDRVIVEDEAKVIRRISELYDSGSGGSRIAATLNSEGVPSPTGGTWTASSVKDVLGNTVYGGIVTWGRRRVDPGKGTLEGKTGIRVRADETAWVTVEREDLRIVPADIYDRVQARLAKQRAAFLRSEDGSRIAGSYARADVDAKYFLTGFCRCATCGGPLVADSKPNGSGVRKLFYRCETARKAGSKVCPNRLAVPGDLLEGLVTKGILAVVEPSHVIEVVEREIEAAVARRGDQQDVVATLEAALAKSKGRIARLTDAIADEEDAPEAAILRARLRDEAAHRKTLEANLATAKSSAAAADTAEIADHVLAQVEPYGALLTATSDNLPAVRRALRRLGVQVKVHPATGPVGQRSVVIEASGTFKSLLPDDVVAAFFSGVELPDGFESWSVQELKPIAGGSDAPLAGGTLGGDDNGQGPPRPPRGRGG